MNFGAYNLLDDEVISEKSFRLCTREDFERFDHAEYYDQLQEETPDSMMCLDEWGETYLKGNPTAEGETAVFRAFATLTDNYADHLDQFSGFFWEMTAI